MAGKQMANLIKKTKGEKLDQLMPIFQWTHVRADTYPVMFALWYPMGIIVMKRQGAYRRCQPVYF